MSGQSKYSPAAKFVLIALIFCAIVGGGTFAYRAGWLAKASKIVAPEGRQVGSILGKGTRKSDDGTPIIKVGVVTWGGYIGGQYFNNGFKASTDSRYYKDYGIKVEFVLLDEFEPSRNAWKSDAVDLLWGTADSFVTEARALADAGYDPQIVFQADWSRGGDAIVVKHGINSVGDLRGKKISFAEGTPSHTFLLKTLSSNEMEYTDIIGVPVGSAPDAASRFKSGVVDAAVVWSPDDADCLANVPGSKVLTSTKQATNIIADIFFAKKSYIESHQKELAALVEGWLKGAAEINSDAAAKKEAIKILMEGLGVKEDWATRAINNVRLTTYGDNVNFFDLNGNYSGVKGEDLYVQMAGMYTAVAFMPSDKPAPPWRTVTNLSILKSINLSGPEDAAEGGFTFAKPTASDVTAPALATKTLTVNFLSGSAVLDENAKTIIDMGFAATAQQFAKMRVRIAGNTDSVGGRDLNRRLSYQRANSVANYLAERYWFDPNRFIMVGNGPDNPVADNSTEAGRAKNRRTDFQLLE